MLGAHSTNQRCEGSGFRAHFTKNHQKGELPQQATDARVAIVRADFFRHMSPRVLRSRRAELSLWMRSNRPRNLRPEALMIAAECPDFDFLTFRLFDVFSPCPNTCPPLALAHFPRALCHLMSPSRTRCPAPSEPMPQGVAAKTLSHDNVFESKHHPSNDIAPATACAMGSDEWPSQLPLRSRRAPALPHIDVSTFRRFHQKPPKTRTAPTHVRHERWHTFHERCVTLCHLQSCRTCAQAARLSLPWAPCIFPRRVQFLMMFPQHHSGVSGGGVSGANGAVRHAGSRDR